MNQAVANITEGSRGALLGRMAQRFGVDQDKLLTTLKRTAFKTSEGEPTNEQMLALMVVADQHGLNPFLREIYAFPDKGGVTPVVGVDGWARIINNHPQFDGMDFEQDDESCTCRMYRKDRDHPIQVTEYLRECKRNTGPWSSHPRRMLRHKAMIQCARVAFSFSGIYDPDEAEAIAEHRDEIIDVSPSRAERPDIPDGKLREILTKWKDTIEAGDSTPDKLIALLETKYTLTDEHKQRIQELAVTEVGDDENPEP